MLHELKIDDVFAERRENGLKPFEIRFNDRDYQVGDTIRFEKQIEIYEIVYIHTGLGMKEGYVCMTLKELDVK